MLETSSTHGVVECNCIVTLLSIWKCLHTVKLPCYLQNIWEFTKYNEQYTFNIFTSFVRTCESNFKTIYINVHIIYKYIKINKEKKVSNLLLNKRVLSWNNTPFWYKFYVVLIIYQNKDNIRLSFTTKLYCFFMKL